MGDDKESYNPNSLDSRLTYLLTSVDNNNKLLGQHLEKYGEIDEKLTEIKEQTTKTNGRVTKLEYDFDQLKSENAELQVQADDNSDKINTISDNWKVITAKASVIIGIIAIVWTLFLSPWIKSQFNSFLDSSPKKENIQVIVVQDTNSISNLKSP